MRIGFSLNKSNSGPALFLKKLQISFEELQIAKTSYCFDPRVSCNVFANKVYRFWNKPYVFRVDGISFDLAMPKEQLKEQNEMMKKGIGESLGVVYQSEFSKKMVESILELTPQNHEIIINGTDLKEFTPIGNNVREELEIPEDAFVFITSAKWRTHKRLHDIIETFIRYKKTTEKQVYLLIIGDTSTVLKHKIAEKNIIYIDFIPNTELPKYLRTANCYLFLSWLEACPNSVVEAIACGLPVICSNQGGTGEIVKLTNGGIVAEADDDFNYEYTYLYNPPNVKYDVVVSVIQELVSNYDHYKRRINVEPIDINNVSRRYFEFVEKVYKKD